MEFALILCLAATLDAIFGDPRSIPHPVRLIGRAITFWNNIFFNDTNSFIRGLAVVFMTLTTTGLFVLGIFYLSGCNILVHVYMLYSALAWRDLKDETLPVFLAMLKHDLPNARKYLAYVVGRDTCRLNETEITRALIETIGENSIDGAISVIFFATLGYAVNRSFGMCMAVWIFKASSTLDSMLGYEALGSYGTPSARLDDILNFLPARLGGIIIVLAGGLMGCNMRDGFRVFMMDRLKHSSPNSAHGESAFAGVLGIRLGGGAYYDGKFEARPFLNENAHEPAMSDILRAWRLLDVSCSLSILVVILFLWTI